MTPYLFVTFLGCFLANIFGRKKIIYGRRKKDLIWIKSIVISAPFIVLSMIRDKTIGIDYTAYSITYFNQGLGITRKLEVLGELINSIARSFNNPWIIIIIYSILVCLLSIYWILNQTKYLELAIFLFYLTGFFNWSLNIMRQSVSTIIVYLGIQYLFKEEQKIKNRIIFAIYILISIMFHKTSFVYFILLFVDYDFFTKNFKKFVYLLPAAFFSSKLVRPFFMWISKKLNLYFEYFNNYYDNEKYTGSLIMITSVIFLLIVLTHKYWENKGKRYKVLALFSYLSLIFSLIGNIIPNNARIIFLFYPLSIISIPEFLFLEENKVKRKIILVILVFSLLVFFLNSFVVNNWGETIPYKINLDLF